MNNNNWKNELKEQAIFFFSGAVIFALVWLVYWSVSIMPEWLMFTVSGLILASGLFWCIRWLKRHF